MPLSNRTVRPAELITEPSALPAAADAQYYRGYHNRGDPWTEQRYSDD